MTREEASNILDDYDVNFEGHTAEEIAKAFDVAFRALEQQPCEDWYDVPSDNMTLEQARQAVKIMCENPIEDIIEHINYERGRGIPYKGGDTDGKSD